MGALPVTGTGRKPLQPLSPFSLSGPPPPLNNRLRQRPPRRGAARTEERDSATHARDDPREPFECARAPPRRPAGATATGRRAVAAAAGRSPRPVRRRGGPRRAVGGAEPVDERQLHGVVDGDHGRHALPAAGGRHGRLHRHVAVQEVQRQGAGHVPVHPELLHHDPRAAAAAGAHLRSPVGVRRAVGDRLQAEAQADGDGRLRRNHHRPRRDRHDALVVDERHALQRTAAHRLVGHLRREDLHAAGYRHVQRARLLQRPRRHGERDRLGPGGASEAHGRRRLRQGCDPARRKRGPELVLDRRWASTPRA